MDSESKLDEFFNQYKLPLAVGLVGLVLLIGGIITSGILPKTFVKSSKYPAATPYPSKNTVLKVDVSGAVVNPGVYTLNFESRVEEAIKAAGGVTENADPIYVSKSLNLAQKVSDGMKIYIPQKQDISKSGVVQSQQVAGVASEAAAGPVNINNASAADLDKLPGVGEATAQKIIGSRPYGSIEELLTKKAVTRSTYEKIKGLVSVY